MEAATSVPQLFCSIYQHITKLEGSTGAEKVERACNIAGDLLNLTKKLSKVTNGEVEDNIYRSYKRI